MADLNVLVDNANIVLSPYSVRKSGSSFATFVGHAYARVRFTNATGIQIDLDVTPQTGVALAAGNYPRLAWFLTRDDISYNAGWTLRQSTSADNVVTLQSGLTAARTYEFLILQYWFSNAADRWTTPVVQHKVEKFILNNAGGTPSVLAVTPRTKNALFFGDSRTEAIGGTSAADIRTSWAWYVARALDAEAGFIAYGGQGVTDTTGAQNVPVINSAYDLYHAGQSRLVGGLFSPVPDYVFIPNGGVDAILGVVPSNATFQAAYETLLTNILAACGAATKVFSVIPFGGEYRSAISSAILAIADSRVLKVDLGTDVDRYFNTVGGASEATSDGSHPTAVYQGELGTRVAKAVQELLGGSNRGFVIGG